MKLNHNSSFLNLTLIVISWVLINHSKVAAEIHKDPNIFLILVDDMGYGDAKCFNPDSQIETPHIDKLADEGMRFFDAHAAGPLCHVSRYGLMTGQYPFRANPGAWRKKATIAPDQLTLGQLLQKQNYRTAMVGKWHLGFDEKTYDDPLPGGPVDRGFDSYFGIRASTDIPPYFYIKNDRAVMPPSLKIDANASKGWSPIQGAFWRAGGISPDLKLDEVLPRFIDEARSVVDKHVESQDQKPLFLYLALPAPHTPWLPSSSFAEKSKAGMYGDFMTMVDAEIGRFLEKIEEANLANNSLIIFTSDNGPVWYKEDEIKFKHHSTGQLKGMKADAWEGGHRMPFIVKWPNVIEPNSKSHQLISFVDVLATIADITNYSLSENDAPDSVSFLPLLQQTYKSKSQFRNSPLVLQSGSGFMTIRDGHWKLIQGLGSGGFSNPKRLKPQPGQPSSQLYNLQTDLEESNNLYSKYPKIAQELQSKLTHILNQ